MTKPLFTESEWTIESIDKTWKVIEDYGKNWLGLEFYEPRFDIISADEMISNYTTHGLPECYSHWSFGKNFITTKKDYTAGNSGLAYELVINSNPAIVYLMESNTMSMMALTMSHAAVGHCSVNTMNYLFKEWTNADFILEYMSFAKAFIQDCEEKYGEEEVEWILDRAHSLQFNSIDRYKRPPKKTKQQKLDRHKKKSLNAEQIYRDTDVLFDKTEKMTSKMLRDLDPLLSKNVPKDRGYPEENLLYFIEKHSRHLSQWEREILRIVRTIGQYFYPQTEIHVLHEGWASFCHYQIMQKMYEDGHLTDGAYFEFLDSHTAVVNQPEQASFQLNPYKLGFSMFMDLKRVCEEPTEEDQKWFPELCNTDWKESLKDIMMNYKDDSFILQYLSPKVIRDLGLMVTSRESMDTRYGDPLTVLVVTDIQDDEGVWEIREALSKQYGLSANRQPILEVKDYHYFDDYTMILNYKPLKGRELSEETKKVIHYIQDLWGDPVQLNNNKR